MLRENYETSDDTVGRDSVSHKRWCGGPSRKTRMRREKEGAIQRLEYRNNRWFWHRRNSPGAEHIISPLVAYSASYYADVSLVG